MVGIEEVPGSDEDSTASSRPCEAEPGFEEPEDCTNFPTFAVKGPIVTPSMY